MKKQLEKLFRIAEISIITAILATLLLMIGFQMIREWNPVAIFFILSGVVVGVASFENYASLRRLTKEIIHAARNEQR